ncbi:Predicted DNA damage inducible protein [Phaffia rhodozyma]|uniref:DNA polymerase kappa n=1 Tax=Phaffia rhodozyma TaxID=264483 RepID=A0A0F7SW12_PHARH|nr:Predicted DNA damage inducible protein [Phaffia rhodozyma]
MSSKEQSAMASAGSSSSSTEISDSMLRRMAGQSVNKAGLKKDQSEINKIIAEASKGSKFYENEREKDEKLGIQIMKLLDKRDRLLKEGVDLRRLERECDTFIQRIESQRDLSQTIVHVDMDAFYANVELLADPTLEGIAFGVGTGVLTTASYEARAYGVRSGMPVFVAKKLCPHLRMVPATFNSYGEYSGKVMEVFRRFDPNMAKVGMDEAFLNLTTYIQEEREKDGTGQESENAMHKRRERIVRTIRETCKKVTGLTVSAGIAPNKMLAKICSDINKPNNQYILPFTRQAVLDFTRTLPIRKIPGIGRVSERCLEALGVITCGDIITKRAELHLLNYGVIELLKAGLGATSNVVEAGRREDRKSVGCERTFREKSKREELIAIVEDVAEELTETLQKLEYTGKTLSLKYKTHDFKLHTKSHTLQHGEYKTRDSIQTWALKALEESLPLKLRLLGLRVNQLRDLRKKGGLEQYFTNPSHSRKLHEDDEEAEGADFNNAIILDSDEDLEDSEAAETEQVERAINGSPFNDAITNAASSTAVPFASKQETETTHHPMISCPICSRTFPSSTTNQDLNAHIDVCLSKDTIQQLSSRRSSPILGSSESVSSTGEKSVGSKSANKRSRRDIPTNKEDEEDYDFLRPPTSRNHSTTSSSASVSPTVTSSGGSSNKKSKNVLMGTKEAPRNPFAFMKR